jgi:methylmalonyl-CoA mutase
MFPLGLCLKSSKIRRRLMSAEAFLAEFPPVSTETWEQVIRQDLKGADYGEKLIWHSPEGIEVKPYYREEDIAGPEFMQPAPGHFPYARGTHETAGWRIREQIDVIDPEEANSAARCAVAAGAEEIAFAHVAVTNASDLAVLVANLAEIPVHFSHPTAAMIRLVMERMDRRKSGVMRSAALDWMADPAFSADVISTAPAEFVPFTIRAQEYQNEGATAVEEVAFALASGVDFLAEMQDRGVRPDRAADAVAFSFAMGPEYFMQIAKLRAFRMVWARAVTAFGAMPEHAKARLYALTSRWNRTVYDPHNNMLRATTEAMSAVLGGADSIYIVPFDECYNVGDETSRRLARNTLLILKREAHLAQVADAGGGSYYLEALTSSIARQAWKQLQEIEGAGGYRKAIPQIDGALAARKSAQVKSVMARKRVLTGTNRFANPGEQAFERVNGAIVHDAVRAALPFEDLRLRTERHARVADRMPRILLAETGDVRMGSARSGFAADFFACAGLSSEVRRFRDAAEIAAERADLVVLCSSDPEYLAIGLAVMEAMKARGSHIPVLIAGNPDTADQLRAAGIDDFIHLRSSPIDVLARVQNLLGMGKS